MTLIFPTKLVSITNDQPGTQQTKGASKAIYISIARLTQVNTINKKNIAILTTVYFLR